MKKLEGKVAIITGAGQGIGKGIALAFAKEGANVVIADMNPEAAGATAEEIRRLGVKALAMLCDVSNEKQVSGMVAETVRELGLVSILVNNAHKWQVKPGPLEYVNLEGLAEADWDINFQTGPKGTWFCSKAVFPHMKDKGGRIINLGSSAGIRGGAGQGAYAASKEAIRGLTRVAAREWGKYGITVNVICPMVTSPANLEWQRRNPELAAKMLAEKPISRWGDPEMDVGRTAVFLASDESLYVTGQTFNVDGGDRMF